MKNLLLFVFSLVFGSDNFNHNLEAGYKGLFYRSQLMKNITSWFKITRAYDFWHSILSLIKIRPEIGDKLIIGYLGMLKVMTYKPYAVDDIVNIVCRLTLLPVDVIKPMISAGLAQYSGKLDAFQSATLNKVNTDVKILTDDFPRSLLEDHNESLYSFQTGGLFDPALKALNDTRAQLGLDPLGATEKASSDGKEGVKKEASDASLTFSGVPSIVAFTIIGHVLHQIYEKVSFDVLGAEALSKEFGDVLLAPTDVFAEVGDFALDAYKSAVTQFLTRNNAFCSRIQAHLDLINESNDDEDFIRTLMEDGDFQLQNMYDHLYDGLAFMKQLNQLYCRLQIQSQKGDVHSADLLRTFETGGLKDFAKKLVSGVKKAAVIVDKIIEAPIGKVVKGAATIAGLGGVFDAVAKVTDVIADRVEGSDANASSGIDMIDNTVTNPSKFIGEDVLNPEPAELIKQIALFKKLVQQQESYINSKLK